MRAESWRPPIKLPTTKASCCATDLGRQEWSSCLFCSKMLHSGGSRAFSIRQCNAVNPSRALTLLRGLGGH